jgi:hypothetical protein
MTLSELMKRLQVAAHAALRLAHALDVPYPSVTAVVRPRHLQGDQQ